MQAYIIKRFLLFVPTLLMATLIVFVILRLMPGDPALMKLTGETGEADFTQEQLDAMRAKLGTDRPLYIQYGSWVWGMLQLDFGMSLFYEDDVSKDLAQKVPITLELTILALLLANVVAIPLGVISAIKQDSLIDYISRVITISGVALPNFWVGIMMIFFLVLLFDWIPPIGYVNLWEDPWTNLKQLIFPALALGFYNMAFVARITRSSMLEVYREDYIRTARSKGPRREASNPQARPQERSSPGGHCFRIRVWPPAGRHNSYREHLPGARHGVAAHRQHIPQGLHHGASRDRGNNVISAVVEPVPRYCLRLVEPKSPL